MKKLRLLLWIVLGLSITLYAAVYLVILPAAAKLSVPYKWNQVVPGLHMQDYYGYIGLPPAQQHHNNPGENAWEAANGNYRYTMNIRFGGDSIATAVTIRYTFSNWLFHRSGTIRSATSDD